MKTITGKGDTWREVTVFADFFVFLHMLTFLIQNYFLLIRIKLEANMRISEHVDPGNIGLRI